MGSKKYFKDSLIQTQRMEKQNNPLMDTFVRVYGIASKSVKGLIVNAMKNWPMNSRNLILFVDYSDFDISIGTEFTLFAEDIHGNKLHAISGKLVQVTQSWCKPFDQIPKGHKTVCEIEFDEQSANLIRSKLPTVGSWSTPERRFLLGAKNEIRTV
jgi:hypothetical protein